MTLKYSDLVPGDFIILDQIFVNTCHFVLSSEKAANNISKIAVLSLTKNQKIEIKRFNFLNEMFVNELCFVCRSENIIKK